MKNKTINGVERIYNTEDYDQTIGVEKINNGDTMIELCSGGVCIQRSLRELVKQESIIEKAVEV